MTLNDPQPSPQPSPGSLQEAAHWLVCADLLERAAMGQAKYGTPLTVDNGRNHLIDAYQEALDLLCYLRMAIEAQKQQQSPLTMERASLFLRDLGYTILPKDREGLLATCHMLIAKYGPM